MNHLGAQAGQSGQGEALEVAEEQLDQFPCVRVLDQRAHGFQAHGMFEVPQQFVAGSRVEEAAQGQPQAGEVCAQALAKHLTGFGDAAQRNPSTKENRRTSTCWPSTETDVCRAPWLHAKIRCTGSSGSHAWMCRSARF